MRYRTAAADDNTKRIAAKDVSFLLVHWRYGAKKSYITFKKGSCFKTYIDSTQGHKKYCPG